MNDFDKIKERNRKDDFKGVLFIGLIFIVAVGLIVFIIIQLTNQYMELKEKLVDTEKALQSTLTNPDEVKEKIVISANKSNSVKVENLQKEVKQIKISDALKVEENNEQAKKNDNKSKEKSEVAKGINNDSKVKDVKDIDKVNVNENIKRAKTRVKTQEKKSVSIVTATPKSSGKYVLQLMAFRDLNVAKKELKKVKQYYSDAFIMTIDLGKKGVWHRVRCCFVDDYQEAKNKVKELKDKLKVNPIIVKVK
ncbi:SPOR domain-containing protein [Deferribacter thermophilus]|uniref:SPOR domain-containing protein n=1 Tax=Deferribacter thermophilus TaxID=53573 RepID=UPI003C1956B8